MRKLERYLFSSFIFLVIGLSYTYGQNDKTHLMKKDTARQDKTRLINKKGIKDTSKVASDTSFQKIKKGKKNENMYLVPNKKSQSK